MKNCLPGVLLCAVLLADIARAETVVIDAEDDFAPFSSIDKSRHGAIGLAPELVREAFRSQGVDVEYRVVPFGRCTAEVEAGTVVGCFDLSVESYNRQSFLWPKLPLFQETLSIYARSDSSASHLFTHDLRGTKVALTNGGTYPEEILRDDRIAKDNSPSDRIQFQKLLLKRVDYALVGLNTGAMLLHDEPAFRGKIKRVGVVYSANFYLAFSKSHADGTRMLAVFDRGMQEIQRNGSYNAISAAFRARNGIMD